MVWGSAAIIAQRFGGIIINFVWEYPESSTFLVIAWTVRMHAASLLGQSNLRIDEEIALLGKATSL
jgi:hypothetical protein